MSEPFLRSVAINSASIFVDAVARHTGTDPSDIFSPIEFQSIPRLTTSETADSDSRGDNIAMIQRLKVVQALEAVAINLVRPPPPLFPALSLYLCQCVSLVFRLVF